jgi:HAMP domain-containing protein
VKIRTQNLIAILPLFLGMAAVAGGMTYFTAHNEMLWGLQEEASSLSVAMAEFVGGDSPPATASTPVTVRRFEALSSSFQRVLDRGQAKYIFALDPSGQAIWSVGGKDADQQAFVPPADLIAPTAEQRAELAKGTDAITSEVTKLPGGVTAMIAFSPIRARDGAAAGYLGVVIDADRVSTLSRALLFSLGRLTVLALIIGTLAALFISFLLTRNVRALSKAALEVAGGEYDREIQIGTIQELSDLSNTFNTMSSVLKDLIERTQRTLIEGEQFRTPLDLARSYRQDGWTDLDRSYGGVYVASRSIGDGHPGDLFGVVEREGVVTVFVGRITQHSELDSAIAAAATRRAIEEGSRHWAVPQVIEEICRLLRIRVDAVAWMPGSEAEAVVTTYDGSGVPRSAQVRLDQEQTVLLHTFPGRAGDVLHRWKRVFQQMSPDALVENLGRTLDSSAMGTLVAVGREPVGAETVEVS